MINTLTINNIEMIEVNGYVYQNGEWISIELVANEEK